MGKQWFDNVVLFFILMNCVIMAIERPSIKDGSTERKVIDVSNHIFTIVFTIEMCIKVCFLNTKSKVWWFSNLWLCFQHLFLTNATNDLWVIWMLMLIIFLQKNKLFFLRHCRSVCYILYSQDNQELLKQPNQISQRNFRHWDFSPG